MEFFSNKSIVGTHYYKVLENKTVLHINHMENGHHLINMIAEVNMEIMKHPENYDMFDFEPEKMITITEEEFVAALRESIFELSLFEYVETK